MAFSMLEPMGSDVTYLGSAIVASTVANVNRGKKTGKTYTPIDFFPKFKRRGKQSIDQAVNFAKQLTAGWKKNK